MKYLHHIIDKFILSLIGRSCTILSDRDSRIKKELSYLPENFTAGVAVKKKGLYIVIKKQENKVKYFGYHRYPENIDLKLYFKDEEFAYQVLAAKEGIRQAFSEHKVVVEGDLEYAVSLIYIIEIVEAYIMSDQFAEEVLASNFEREISRLQLIFRSLSLFREKGEI
ncbi:SCP-2 sterol transfer family protein [Halanaerobium saccharolyticum]|uniref:SCP-2 sterol transfer family protein n=1 Tax=Halanaerobium saccharolyticum TaxID=43595 RepID=A0A4R7Z5U0_9FIRM|nr:SCP2 sterol-binding domain-containing protein [Halanaerobium saccharolyticum]RAK10625.1 SCP-2 sterol transfer family protein [Halanaerobium saccharolyticum]TDW06618.1 SCP-2 sterol transfer family protein [Halanaerobium saccharolyticum]TDX62253.1 SCP-2 sterol transfer family protein [Halanaerobium saccharolyticum]